MHFAQRIIQRATTLSDGADFIRLIQPGIVVCAILSLISRMALRKLAIAIARRIFRAAFAAQFVCRAQRNVMAVFHQLLLMAIIFQLAAGAVSLEVCRWTNALLAAAAGP